MPGFFDYDGSGEDDSDLVLLPDWSDRSWKSFLAHGNRRSFATDEHVLVAGQPSQSIYLVADGLVLAVAGRGRRRGRLVNEIGPGGVVGEVSFLDGEPPSLDVIAAAPTSAIEITRAEFDAFAGHHPDLAHEVLLELGRVLAIRLRRMTIRAIGR